MKRESHSLEETQKIASDFALGLTPGERATVVALGGDLGAGKTAFVQALALHFGVPETVTSPTFVIEKIYKLGRSDFSHLIHIDAYRIADSSELAHLGWADITADPKNIICVEWPERIASILPEKRIPVLCSFVNETTHIYEW